jgi:signal transduction histidine kinase
LRPGAFHFFNPPDSGDTMMNIAVVGGGTRCRNLIDMIDAHQFREIHPRVIAVADIDPQAPGLLRAVEKGLDITNDYNDFFNREDIQLIIEMTGEQEIYNDILQKKKTTVRAIDHRTSALFWEIHRVALSAENTRRMLQEKSAMCSLCMNDLIQEDVMIIGRDYRIQDMNDSMLKRLGLDFEDVIGRFCYEITHHQQSPCSGDQHPCPLVAALRHRKPSKVTHVHLDSDSKEIYYSISCYPIFNGEDVVGAIELSRDITGDIRMQRIMAQQDKLASIGRLSAGVAHEINNPLTTILTTAMLIQEDLAPDDPTYEELETITKETLRCRKIVTSLLEFARQKKPAKRINDLNDAIGESLLLTQKQAAFNDVQVESRLASDLPPFSFDKGQIEQVLINLVINALEATPGGGKITVSSALLSGTGEAEITVTDTGEGIAEENVERLFDPFYTTKETGTGLGLAISHGIVEQHGGRLTVVSTPGKGSTFTIRLPLGQGE